MPSDKSSLQKNRKYHWFVLLGVVGIFCFLAITKISWDHQNLVFAGIRLPRLCLLGRLISFGCPFCGLTRSLWCCIHGHWSGAFYYNCLGLLLFLGLALQIPLRLYLILIDKSGVSTQRLDSRLSETFFYLALVRWVWIIWIFLRHGR